MCADVLEYSQCMNLCDSETGVQDYASVDTFCDYLGVDDGMCFWTDCKPSNKKKKIKYFLFNIFFFQISFAFFFLLKQTSTAN